MYKLTKEQAKLSKENYSKTVEYFKSINRWQEGMVLHHLDANLRHNDVEEYIKWLNVVPMTIPEHARIHMTEVYLKPETRKKMSDAKKGKTHTTSEETRRKISKAKKGTPCKEETKEKISKTLKGRGITEDHKQNISKGQIGLYWWNNGVINMKAETQPEGFVRGMKKRK